MTDTHGKLLVAPPGMPDWRFQKSVVYIFKHDVGGAAGVIVNKKCNNPDFAHVCSEGGLTRKLEVNPPVFYGGPIMTNVIGILHSKDIILGSSNTEGPIAFTLDRKMLEIIAQGGGPKQKIITLGMANWDAGQLESELDPEPPRPKTMSWLVLHYDEQLIFGPQPEDLWEMCVSRAVESKTKEITGKIFKN